MDFDGTISTEVALYHNKEEYDDIVTMGLPLDNAGKPIPAQLGVGGAFIPKGAKNVEVAKDFMKFLIQPKVVERLSESRGWAAGCRRCPSLVKNDPFWLDPNDPHRAAYAREGLLDPTVRQLPGLQPRLCRGQRHSRSGARPRPTSSGTG